MTSTREPFGENLTASKHLGLAEHAPRLAVFFVIFGLALVGLPGTLSFCSQDLLIHGTLMSHPLTGLLLPIAIAMNAVSIFRLFTRLFLGKRRTGFTVMADALPRERWILTIVVLFVVLGGLFPKAIVVLVPISSDAVEQVAYSSRSPTQMFGPSSRGTKSGPSGESFLMIKPPTAEQALADQLTVVVNRFDELRSRVPGRK